MIRIERTVAGIREALGQARTGLVGLVPTMGALHRGHLRLIEVAAEHTPTVVVSIFVNPLQFDQPEDYARYERDLERDAQLAQNSGAHLIFAPGVEEMYPAPTKTFVEVEGLTEHFCGAARPGHFRGVTTVVSKLFHMVQPDVAVFGEKDAQQLAVIERMVLDLNFPVRILPVPTVREPDGLALSSRNRRLNSEERITAVCLSQALTCARDLIRAGERDRSKILLAAEAFLALLGVRVEYLDLADPRTFQPVISVVPPVRVLGAIRVGGTRLIDNLICP